MSADLECPYCGKELEVCHDDGQGYDEDNNQMECWGCNKTFIFATTTTFYYEARKADCLNDGEHNYKPTVTIPDAFTQMKCSICGDRREPTTEERATLGIGTKEEYFESLKKI